MTAVRHEKPGGGGEKREQDPRQRVISMFFASFKQPDPKTWFIDQLTDAGWNPEVGKVVGASGPKSFVTAANRWFIQAETRIDELTEVKPLAVKASLDVSMEPAEVRRRFTQIARGLSDVPIDVVKVEDPKGIRDAFIVATPLAWGMPQADQDNIVTAVTSGHIEGLTMQIPWGFPRISPWQKGPPGRSIMILPAGAKRFEDKGYAYVCKALSFNPESRVSFDIRPLAGQIFHEDVSAADRSSPAFVEDGTLRIKPHLTSLFMGMNFFGSERQHCMMLLALKRGVRNFVGVDEPVLYGMFEKVRSEDGVPQGFTVVRIREPDIRSDYAINLLTNVGLGTILREHPNRQGFYDDALLGIDELSGKIETGFFKQFIDAGRLTQRELEKFSGNLASIRTKVREWRGVKEKDVDFVRWMMILQESGVERPNFGLLLKGADKGVLNQWRHGVEQVCFLSGVSNRLLIEHAIANEQHHLANVRCNMSDGSAHATVCDWEQMHDIASMTYPQAFGYVALSLRTMLTMLWKGQKSTSLLDKLGCDMPAAGLRGFLLQQSGPEEFQRDFNPRVVQQVVDLLHAPVDERRRRRGIGPLDGMFLLAGNQRVVESEKPFFELLRQIYTEQRHDELQRRFNVE